MGRSIVALGLVVGLFTMACGDDEPEDGSTGGGGSGTAGTPNVGGGGQGGIGGVAQGGGGAAQGGAGGSAQGGAGGSAQGGGGSGGAPVVTGWVGEYGPGWATSVVPGPNDTFVMAGYVAGTDSFAAKVDATGAIVWQTDLGVASNDRLFNIRSVPTGGYMAVGYRLDDGSLPSVRILRLDEAGAITWERAFNRPNLLDDTMGLAVTSTGGAAVSFRTANVIGPRNWVYHLLVVDDAGAIVTQSQQDHGLGSAVEVRDVAQIGDSAFYIAGRVPQCPNCTGSLAALMRIDGAGNLVWSKRYEIMGGGVSVMYAVAPLGDGNLAVAGTIDGTTDAEPWVAKVNAATGELMWSKRVPHAGGDIATSVVETASNNLLVAGSAFQATVGQSYAWFMELDSTGVMTDAFEYAHGGFDVFPEAWPAPGGGFIMNGMGSTQIRLLRIEPDGGLGTCSATPAMFSASEDVTVVATDYTPTGAALDLSLGTATTVATATTLTHAPLCAP